MSASIRIVALALLGASGVALAVQHHPAHAGSARTRPAQPLTLEQAVARVQNRTGGKVLKADSRHYGKVVEYRIKVLTPKGHVRVVTVRSDENRDQTNKEKH